MIEKYVGRRVEIIYLDSKGIITQRKIEVRSIKGAAVKASAWSSMHRGYSGLKTFLRLCCR